MTNQIDYYFKRTNSFMEKEISLDHIDLEILALIEQNKSARQIRTELNIKGALLKQKIMALHKQNVIEVVDGTYEYLENEFLEIMRDKLIDLAGPLGELLLDDVLENLKLKPERIPKIITKDIIQSIAKGIPDEEQSKVFMDSMMAKLNGK